MGITAMAISQGSSEEETSNVGKHQVKDTYKTAPNVITSIFIKMVTLVFGAANDQTQEKAVREQVTGLLAHRDDLPACSLCSLILPLAPGLAVNAIHSSLCSSCLSTDHIQSPRVSVFHLTQERPTREGKTIVQLRTRLYFLLLPGKLLYHQSCFSFLHIARVRSDCLGHCLLTEWPRDEWQQLTSCLILFPWHATSLSPGEG